MSGHRQRVQRRSDGGFSFVELLVTIVLAGIIFAAMTPFFANALRRVSADEYRVDSTSIVQDRIEQVRLLKWADIDQAKLNTTPTSASFGDGRFGHDYWLFGESRAYRVDYVVTPESSATAPQKYVRVSVRHPDESFVTSADTIIMNPDPGDTDVTDSEPTNLSMTVYFDNWTYVKSPGVVIKRVQTNVVPNVTTTCSPSGQMPTAGLQEVTWTGLTGGPNYTYQVFCSSTKASYVLAAPPFRMWSTGRLKFDTYPGGD